MSANAGKRPGSTLARWGPWGVLGAALILVALKLPAAYSHPAYDLWTNMGVGWAWQTYPNLNVYDPPALRGVLYASETYGDFAQVSAWGLPFNSFISTPFLLFLYAPLSWLSLPAARALWFGLGMLLYGGVAAWMVRVLWRESGRWLGAGFALYAAGYVPAYMDWGQGNTNGVLLALALIAGLAVERGRDWIGGTCVTVLTLFKLYPGLLFVYLLYKRAWRLAAAAALSGLVLGALCVWAVGVEAAGDYLTVILPTIGGGNTSAHNQGLTGLWLHLQFPELLGKLEPPPIGRPVALSIVSCVLAGVAAWRVRGPLKREGYALSPEYALVWTTMLLLAPSVWDHYFTLLLLPLGARWREAAANPHPVRIVLTVFVSAGIGLTPALGAGLGIHVRPLMLLLLWGMCLWSVRPAGERPA